VSARAERMDDLLRTRPGVPMEQSLRSWEHYVWLMTGQRVTIAWDTRPMPLRPS
jgi:hypothetical protein